MKQIFSDYLVLLKPRITALVLVTTALGFFLGAHSLNMWSVLLWTLFGTALSCGGSSVLNMYLERDVDRLMHRTKRRPIPAGRIAAAHALAFGVICVLLGVVTLVLKVNLLCGFFALLTAFLYVLVYTPLKRQTWLNTFIGAIPGALPPVGGWAAATGGAELGAWILFAILFIWQHPHFYAIAWMYREDYSRAGLKMLPVIEPDGASTFRQVLIYSALLIPVSVVPYFLGMSGVIYLVGTTILGILFFLVGLEVSRSRSVADARRLLRASVIYLPLLLILIVTDSIRP